MRTVGAPFADRLVFFVVRPFRQTFSASFEALTLSGSHPIRVAEYSVRSLRLNNVDVTSVITVARNFVREAERVIDAINGGDSAE